MVRVEDDAEIPESGAVFTFGKSKFSDNVPSKFWIRNDAIVQVACGDEHSIVVTENGRCYVFGSNSFGQLGLGHTKNITKPTCIKALKQEKVTCAAGGRSHSLLVTESGRVYSFGANGEGQLGLGDTTDRLDPTVLSSIQDKVKMVAAGSYHSTVLTASGKLYLFGSNSEGQLGLDDTKNVSTPMELQLAVNITWAACGYYHTAVVGDGKLFLFGEKEGGKLGLLDKQLQKKSNRPQCIFSITEKVTAVSCGGNHTAALTDCGKLYTFGSGINGQLALGTMIMETGAPSLVGAFDGQKITSVSCGESHTAIVTDLGKLYTCGDGRHGKLALGNENFSNQFNPIYVKKFGNFFVHKVACGGCHMLVLASKQVANDWDNESVEGASESQDNADLGLTARNRRRQKEIIGQKPLPNIDPSLQLGQNSVLDSINKKEAQNDLEQLEKQLTALDENYRENNASNAEDDEESAISEISQFNKTHELSLVGKDDSKLVPVKNSTIINSETLKSVANRPKDKGESDQNQEPEESESEESEDEDDEGEDEEEEEDPNLAEENATKPDQNESETKKSKENSIAENSKPAKKESFLKKMFSFKKRKTKSEEIVTPDKQGESKEIVNNSSKSAPAVDTTPKLTQAEGGGDKNETNNEEEKKAVIANDKVETTEKKPVEKVADKKAVSAKMQKEKPKSASNQSSKACNIL